MAVQTMRVCAVADKLVLDAAHAATSGRLRFVGRTMQRVDRLEDVPEGAVARERDPVDPGDGYYVEAWLPCGAVPVPASGEFGHYYTRAVQEGGLAPADEHAARTCGVPWTPTEKKAGR